MILQQIKKQRKGYVLIAVLLVVFVLSYASYRYLDAMTSEYKSSVRSTQAMQVKAYAVSGVHYAMAVMSDPNYQESLAGQIADNPGLFQNTNSGSGEGPRGGGRFSLINIVNNGGQSLVQYGISDESAKLNLNSLMLADPTGTVLYNALLNLPSMTPEIADAIVDWLDVDDTPRTAGAESADYQLYRPKNGPIQNIEELLFVRGVTPQLLFGSDLNRNGQIDPDETAGDSATGWSEFLTAYGREPNVDSTGTQRIDLTKDAVNDLYDELNAVLPGEVTEFFYAYRTISGVSAITSTQTTVTISTGGVTTSSSTTSQNPQTGQNNNVASLEYLQQVNQIALATGLAQSRRKPKAFTDIINTQLTSLRLPTEPANAPRKSYPSPLNNPTKLNEYLPILLDKTSILPGTELNPRVNINTASYEVLLGIPGMTEEMVNNIIATRSSLNPNDLATTTAAWLVTQLNMPTTTFTAMLPFITGKSSVYKVQSLGYFANGGLTSRVEAVFDTNLGRPRIIWFRDLTELGKSVTPPR